MVALPLLGCFILSFFGGGGFERAETLGCGIFPVAVPAEDIFITCSPGNVGMAAGAALRSFGRVRFFHSSSEKGTGARTLSRLTDCDKSSLFALPELYPIYRLLATEFYLPREVAYVISFCLLN